MIPPIHPHITRHSQRNTSICLHHLLKNANKNEKKKAIIALKKKFVSATDIQTNKVWKARQELIESFKTKEVRPIDSFKPKKSSNLDTLTIQLVKHCYGKFPFPKYLEQSWLRITPTAFYNKTSTVVAGDSPFSSFERDISVCIGSGGSVHKEYFKEYGFTKKQTHNILTCKVQVENIIQAIIFGVAFTKNNNSGVSYRICKSEVLNTKLSELIRREYVPNKIEKVKFWIKCIQWFAVNAPDSHQKLDEVIDFVAHSFVQNPLFELHGKGYTFESLYRKTIEWHWSLRRLKKIGSISWEGMPYDSMTFKTWDESNKCFHYWKLDQITDSQSLQKEGTAQRHCVFSYRDRCVSGSCSIWSLRTSPEEDFSFGSGTRKVTIEVSSYGKVVQSRGTANREPTPLEKQLIAKWKVANNLE